jgi:hypothetical protein
VHSVGWRLNERTIVSIYDERTMNDSLHNNAKLVTLNAAPYADLFHPDLPVHQAYLCVYLCVRTQASLPSMLNTTVYGYIELGTSVLYSCYFG